MKISEEVRRVMDREEEWRDVLASVDTGSYCESPSAEGVSVCKIVDLYKQLSDALRDHNRKGYESP